MKSPKKKFKKRVHDFLHSVVTEVLIMLFIIASVTLYILDASWDFSPAVQHYLLIAKRFFNIFFVVEYLTRILISPNPWIFLRTHLVDLIALVPALRFIRLIRILRLFRVINLVRFNRFSKSLKERTQALTTGISSKFYEMGVVFFSLLIVVLIGTFGILLVEKGKNEQFKDVLDGFWWTIVTITTVGYGDKFPETVAGRVLAFFVMLMGLSLFAMITGFVSSFLIERYKREENRGMDILGIKNHVIICGWNSNAATVLQELLQLYKNELKHFVVIAEEKPEYFFTDTVHFIKGDYTKGEVLRRAQIENCMAVIILADGGSGRTAQDIDARTILTTLAVEKINTAIYTCVEILQGENVEHIKNTDVDEYILSANYTGNLLAHSVANRGITKVFNELLHSSIGNQIIREKPAEELIGKTFKECAVDLLDREIGVLIGIERLGDYLLNPKGEVLRENDRLVLLSRAAEA